jgi:hypothetical protein
MTIILTYFKTTFGLSVGMFMTTVYFLVTRLSRQSLLRRYPSLRDSVLDCPKCLVCYRPIRYLCSCRHDDGELCRCVWR